MYICLLQYKSLQSFFIVSSYDYDTFQIKMLQQEEMISPRAMFFSTTNTSTGRNGFSLRKMLLKGGIKGKNKYNSYLLLVFRETMNLDDIVYHISACIPLFFICYFGVN